MVKTIVISSIGGVGRTSTANTTQYYPLTGVLGLHTTETNAQQIIRDAGVLSKIAIRITANSLSGGNLTLTSRKNAGAGNQSITIAAGATGLFEDLTNTDTVAPGDKFNLQSVPPATGTYTFFVISAIFNATPGTKTRIGVGGASDTMNLASTTIYYPLSGSGTFSAALTTETNAKCRMRKAGKFKNMFTQIQSNARTTNTVFRIRKNGANGNQIITVPATTTGFFEDVSNEDTVAVGDDFNYVITTGTGTEIMLCQGIVINFETDTSTGICVKASSADAGGTALPDGGTRYDAIGGSLSSTVTDETQVQMTAREQFAFSELTCLVVQNNVTLASTVTFRVNAADTALAASITASTTGIFSDSSDSVSVSSTDNVSHAVTVPLIGGPETLTLQWISVWTNIEVLPGIGSGQRSNIDTIPLLSFPNQMDVMIPTIKTQTQNVRTL